jgi:hypothetical protein
MEHVNVYHTYKLHLLYHKQQTHLENIYQSNLQLYVYNGLIFIIFLAYCDMVTQQNERVESNSFWHTQLKQIILNIDKFNDDNLNTAA